MKPSIESMREYLDYDPENGIIKWKKRKSTAMPGQVAVSTRKGYLALKFDGKKIGAHIIAWALYYGEWPEKAIDHRDGNPLNNSIANLRITDHIRNQWNRHLNKNNKSGYKGVHFVTRLKKYSAGIRIGTGKCIILGKFETAEEAAHAYNKAAVAYHGEFATLNPVGKAKE